MMPLSPEFREFLRSLNREGVKYLVVGGIAVNYHGYHRSTNDLDVWVGCSRANEERLARALLDFGFSRQTTEQRPLLVEGRILQMGVPPLRIDIITKISGVEFSDCYANRVVSTLARIDIPFIDIEDLKKNKKSAGRYKDLADLEELS